MLEQHIVLQYNTGQCSSASFDLNSTSIHFDSIIYIGEELLTPTTIYVRTVLSLMRRGLVKGYAHITGGGLVGNIPRVLPNGVCVRLDANKWTIPPVFTWLQVLVRYNFRMFVLIAVFAAF